MNEPATTAAVLAVLGVLMIVAVALSRVAGRLGMPVALLFLGIGMAAGSEGLGHIAFEDYRLAFRLGTVTLVLILFDGGLNTPYAAVRRAIAPATALATVGVLLTAAGVAVAAHLFGFGWSAALLLGAIVSSTDAAAVFAVLRTSRIELVRRVATTLELESGLNDPVAVILTVALTAIESGQHVSPVGLAGRIVLELVVGLVAGVVIGRAARFVLHRARPTAAGLLPVLSIAVAFTAFGMATLVHGSGFLATYAAAVVIGNGPMPYRSGILRVHDAAAWLGQVLMFLILGLLSYPSRLVAVAPIGLGLGLVLAVLARPLAVVLCLLPFRFHAREVAFVGWVGLRGAVPIILATLPVFAHAPEAARIFDLVFFIVVVNAVIPGATVRWATRLLRVEVHGPPPPAAVLEISSTLPLGDDVHSFHLRASSLVCGAKVSEVPLPAGAAIMLIMRGEQPIAAAPDAALLDGDHLFVFCRAEDRAEIALLFGREE